MYETTICIVNIAIDVQHADDSIEIFTNRCNCKNIQKKYIEVNLLRIKTSAIKAGKFWGRCIILRAAFKLNVMHTRHRKIQVGY